MVTVRPAMACPHGPPAHHGDSRTRFVGAFRRAGELGESARLRVSE
jgi:hypothetical protein